MNAYRLLRLGLVVAVIVLMIGATAAYLNIHGAFEIIWASLVAIGLLIAAIARKVSPKTRPRQAP